MGEQRIPESAISPEAPKKTDDLSISEAALQTIKDTHVTPGEQLTPDELAARDAYNTKQLEDLVG